MSGHFSEPPPDIHNWSSDCRMCDGPVDEVEGGVLCPECADDNGLCQQCGGALDQNFTCRGECLMGKADMAHDAWKDRYHE